jgi:hypothetical protein
LSPTNYLDERHKSKIIFGKFQEVRRSTLRFLMERPPSLETRVIEAIRGAPRSREVWEAEYPELSPLDEERLMLQNLAATVSRQGTVLARLAMRPQTRVELETEMRGIVDRAPAWLDAHFKGQTIMTLELFLQGMAQTLASQRAAIERVAAEQAADPTEIEETLANAPIPAATPGEERSSLMDGVFTAMVAHLKAIGLLAYDLETQPGFNFEIDI